jgi:hypothetical protein
MSQCTQCTQCPECTQAPGAIALQGHRALGYPCPGGLGVQASRRLNVCRHPQTSTGVP